ncbi:MAG: NUDIX domain-containing protein [Candidatus Paceibacterota bacterium]
MEYFSIIKDSDIFENPLPEPEGYTSRPTVKGIVSDADGAISVLTIHGRSLFPGGGVEDGETFEEAFVRECKEEIGCDIKIISSLGSALEFRNKDAKKYEVHFFVAHVIGEKGIPTTTQENEQGVTIEWLSKEIISTRLATQEATLAQDVYMPYFATRTHFSALQKFLETCE